TYYVDIAAGKTAKFDFAFDNLKEGYYYRLKAMYTNQDGTLTSGGIWDHKWEMKAGVLTWKNNGAIAGMAYKASMAAGSTISGLYADCNKITRLTPNKNPNTIYAFAPEMVVPASLDTCNAVSGNRARSIRLVNDKPFYVPVTFDADSASFTYTFPETEAGTGWHAITIPFEVDSIFVDDEYVTLDDTLKHFWIYEFAAEGNNGEVIFKPATVLRGATPYIIAADETMAGRSIVFCSLDVPFYKSGTDKMVVTSSNYKFYGTTYTNTVKNCYVLNEEGTAFEYVTTNKSLTALSSYFATNLPEETRPQSIVLPDIPVRPIQDIILDETVAAAITAGTYDKLTLKRTLEQGLNAICLPFAVENMEEVFGQGAQAYEFYGLDGSELNFVLTSSIEAGKPYILYVPEEKAEDIVLTNVTIDEASIEAWVIEKDGACFQGTYTPLVAGEYATEIYGLAADGSIVKLNADANVMGFRAFFNLPSDAEGVTLQLYDDATGIKSQGPIPDAQSSIYNLAGQRMSRTAKGISIINGKKTLK
ncbi:MAG: hypothetical protein J5733_05095, partial [Bacteroidaceae bacterium]|nr:hypothetical protein [Bacteroidaceae bacterium]